MTDYRLVIGAVAFLVIIAIIGMLSRKGVFRRSKSTNADPDTFEVAETWTPLFINEKTKHRAYIIGGVEGHTDEVGSSDVKLLLGDGTSSDVSMANFDIPALISSLKTGVPEYHYYPDGINEKSKSEIARVKAELKEAIKQNKIHESERKSRHLTDREKIKATKEQIGAENSAGSTQGYGRNEPNPDQEKDEKGKSSDWK